jgi:NADH-quinone oxidoreductase subunit K
MTIGLGHYLAVGAILFTVGILGIFLNRKNIIIILMSIELILLAVNINLVAFSAFLGDIVGQVFALLVLTVAAAEAAIGLAVLPALLGKAVTGQVPWLLTPFVFVAAVAGSLAGAVASSRLPERGLRLGLVGVVSLMGIRVWVDLLGL